MFERIPTSNGPPAPHDSAKAGALEDEIEITPSMIDVGLVWLYAYNPDRSLDHDRETVSGIIKSALANLPPHLRQH